MPDNSIESQREYNWQIALRKSETGNLSRISSSKANKATTAILNNNVGLEGVYFKSLGFAEKLIDGEPTAPVLPEAGSPADLNETSVAVMEAANNMADTGKIRKSSLGDVASGVVLKFTKESKDKFGEKSLGDLMLEIAHLLLETEKDRRQISTEDAMAKRTQAMEVLKTKVTLAMDAALNEKKAAQKQAIGQIVAGSIGVLAGAISLGFSIYAPFAGAKASATIAAGEADAETAQKAMQQAIDKWNNLAKMVTDLGRASGEIATGSANYDAAKYTFEAKMLNISVEIMDKFIQLTNDIVARDEQDTQYVKNEIDKTLSFLQQSARDISDATRRIVGI